MLPNQDRITFVVTHILNVDLGRYRNNVPFDITEKVFVQIKNQYWVDYLTWIGNNQQLKNQVNRFIGKFIHDYWALQNYGRMKSKIGVIKSYELHAPRP